jgi:hypothetical protein
MAIVSKKCNRCRKPMRNDGTEQNPHWVCNNPSCVKYVPPTPEDNGEEDTEGKTVGYVPDKTEDNGEEDSEDSAE